VRAGQTGYARLIAASGTLIAHGDPEERRRVFLRQEDTFAPVIRAANPDIGARYQDSQGRDVIALAATVPSVGWMVIVEQPVAEAFRGAQLMKRDLYLIAGIMAALALVVGLFIGRSPVRSLELMRQQANAIARGNLDVRVPEQGMDELRQLAEALNEMAQELTRLHAEIRAKERLSTFARVAAGLAHDLQTPLESVRGACDLVLARPDESAARDLLRSAAEVHLPRLHRYVRDLRRLAQDGKVPLELASIDPLALAERVARDAGQSPKWMGVKFKAEGNAAHIWADESLLARAISNLVANGADACMGRPPPFGTVTISVKDADAGATLVVAVSDTGVGIPTDRLADILVNDFRSNKRNSGVGLGLGVARHVAASHGGEIIAHSEAGKGSTFEIRIPRQSASGVAADPRLRGGIEHEQVG
jgi:signal transduction histidine kinase